VTFRTDFDGPEKAAILRSKKPISSSARAPASLKHGVEARDLVEWDVFARLSDDLRLESG